MRAGLYLKADGVHTRVPMCFTQPNAVQLRVTLAQIEPPIWRRLIVPWSFNLGQLHQVIQAASGWWDYHLHQFVIDGLRYGDVEQIGEPEFEGDSRGSTSAKEGGVARGLSA